MESTIASGTATIADFQPVIDALTELARLAPHLTIDRSLTAHRFDDGQIWLQGYGLTAEQVKAWGGFLGQYTHRDQSDLHTAEGYVGDVWVQFVAVEKAPVTA
jgi:hypothetical protein